MKTVLDILALLIAAIFVLFIFAITVYKAGWLSLVVFIGCVAALVWGLLRSTTVVFDWLDRKHW